MLYTIESALSAWVPYHALKPLLEIEQSLNIQHKYMWTQGTHCLICVYYTYNL